MFDHKQYLDADANRYDGWLAELRSNAGIIDVDLDHIAKRHSKNKSGPDSGDLFLYDDDNDIVRLIHYALANATYTFVKAEAVVVHFNTGNNIGLADDGKFLTAVQLVINTTGMNSQSDWRNGWVSTAFPIAASTFGSGEVAES